MRLVISSDFGEFGGTTVGHHVPRSWYQLTSLPPSLQEVVKFDPICSQHSCLSWKTIDNDIILSPLSMVFVSGTSD